jgi:signal transduction histidine kinase
MLHGEKNGPFGAVSKDVGARRRIDSSPSPTSLSTRAAQRLSVLGEMTGGIAHDFRNILSVIDSGLRLAEANLSDPDQVRTFISGAREGIARGVRLTSQLLNFAQRGEIRPCVADANALLKNLELFLKYGAGPSVCIVLECSPVIPKCLVDPSQFAAAILNLVVNARDARASAGGEIRIYTARFQTTPVTSEPGFDGTYVRVRVQDNGSGMPDHVVRRVFEPFFTTKGEKGTGLGIPQVGAFMRHIGGHVTVSSEQGHGTTVDLFFPAIEPDTPLGDANCADAPGDLSATHADNAIRPLSEKSEPMGCFTSDGSVLKTVSECRCG